MKLPPPRKRGGKASGARYKWIHQDKRTEICGQRQNWDWRETVSTLLIGNPQRGNPILLAKYESPLQLAHTSIGPLYHGATISWVFLLHYLQKSSHWQQPAHHFGPSSDQVSVDPHLIYPWWRISLFNRSGYS
jgi:hypothetical protein